MRIDESILLVSGTGRNSGKTTLVCDIINNVSQKQRVIGLKISSHFHKTSSKQIEVYSTGNCSIYEETDFNSQKDSSRMLRAGAFKVFYIQCNDSNLEKVLFEIDNIIPIELPIVCESGSLGLFCKVGLHVVVKDECYIGDKQSANANMKKADMIFQGNVMEFSSIASSFVFSESKWKLHYKY